MIKLNSTELEGIASLFEGIDDSMLISCLQGVIGSAYVRTKTNITAAVMISGEYSFWGGDPLSEDAFYLIEHFFDIAETDNNTAIFPDNCPEWIISLTSCIRNNPIAVPRYGIVKKDYNFDDKLLQSYIDNIPSEYTLKAFDFELYSQAMESVWAKELCEYYASAEDFLDHAIGFAAVKNGILVSACSTMSLYNGGGELSVATHESHRRKGLAYACASAVIKECSLRGIRPCWDAANLISKKMALTLGYEYKGDYTIVHMSKNNID